MIDEKTLRWGILAGIFAVPLIPLFVASNLYFPFITGKAFAFRIIVGIVVTFWLILLLRDPSVRPRRSAMLAVFALFVVSLGISAFLSENPTKSFWSNFERMEGWIGLVHLGAYFVVLVSVMRTEKLWHWFWNTSIGVSVVLGLYGVLQLIGILEIHQGGVRVDATLGNATYFGVYMLFHVFLTAFLLVRNASSALWLKVFYVGALVLQLSMIFYSATRGAILGLVGGVIITGGVLLFSGRNHAVVRKIGAGALIATIVLVGVFFAVKETDYVKNHEVWSRLASISLEEGTTRFTIWEMALRGFQERPVFGWGQESFNYVFNTYYNPSLYSQEPWFDRAHNEFIDWLIAGGAVGFLLYVSLFGVALWAVWRPQSSFSVPERAILTGLIAAYGFHNLFVFDNLLSYILFVSTLAFIAYRSDINAPPLFRSWTNPLSIKTSVITAPLVTVAMLAVIYFVNIPGIVTASTLIKGLSAQEGGLSTNLAYFKKVSERSVLGRQEVREQLLQFGMRIRTLTTDESLAASVIGYAGEQMALEIMRNPNDARLRIFLGSYFRQVGQPDLALPELLAAHELSPQKQQVMFELGALENDRGNLAAAADWFRQAFELAPKYDTARVLYAATLIRMGDSARAKGLLEERFGTATPDDNIILQAYLDVRDYASVIAIAQARVNANPNDTQKRVQLAAAYLQSGDRAGAIRVLRDAIAADPSFKSQGETFIQEIAAGRNP